MGKNILISAGEASGDLHAANMLTAMRKLDPKINARAMGSNKLKAAGAKIIVDCAEIAVVGIIEVLANYRVIRAALNKMQKELKTNRPDLIILVDYQEFNLKLAKTAKKYGVKVLFYISPQVWAWRPNRVHKIGKYIDMMAVLFPFEEQLYKNAKVPVRFVGHPLIDKVKTNQTKFTVINKYGLTQKHPVIGLFPGSRYSEIKRILPIQLEAAKLLNTKTKTQFILAVANALNINDFENYLTDYQNLNIRLSQDNVYDVMQICDAIIATSGTATLEIALMKIPNVIVYKVSWLSYQILKRMVSIDKISLTNIIMQKQVVRELLQNQATPLNIQTEINKILHDTEYRNNMLQDLSQIRQKLGKSGGVKNIARLALSML